MQTESLQIVSKTEKLCNAVAAELLVPHRMFSTAWTEQNIDDIETCIENLLSLFPCSRETLARRALDCAFIHKDEYVSLIGKWKKRFSDKTNRPTGTAGNFYTTAKSHWDPNFVLALARETHMGRTMYTDACRLIGMNHNNFDTLVGQLTEAR